jgi:hypothetical protein
MCTLMGLGGSGCFAMPAVSAASSARSVRLKAPDFSKRSDETGTFKAISGGTVSALWCYGGQSRGDVIREATQSAS